MLSIRGKTGIAYSVQLRDRITNAAIGGLLPVPESSILGFYFLNPSVAFGRYWAHWYSAAGTADERYIGAEKYDHNGTTEVTALALSDRLSQIPTAEMLAPTLKYDFAPTAGDIYVALTGSTSTDGKTPETAWTAAKLYSAIAALQILPNSRILFKGGEIFDLPGSLDLSPSGSLSGLYEVSSYGFQRATLTFPENVSGIVIYNRSGKISNINLTSRIIGGTGSGVAFYSDTPNTTYSATATDCTITGFSNSVNIGSWETPTAKWVGRVKRVRCLVHKEEGIISFTETFANKSHDLQITSCYVEPFSGNGIVLSGCTNSIIENCVADGYRSSLTTSNADNLIWFWRADDCVIKDCVARNARGNVGNTDGGSFGIDIESSRCTIERCFAVNSYGIGVLVIGGAGHIIRNNVLISTSAADMVGEDAAIRLFGISTDIEVLNNTVYLDINASVAARGLVVEQGATTGVIANNIFYAVTNRDLVRTQNANTRLYQNTYYCESAPTTPRLVRGGILFTTLASFRAEGQEMLNGAPLGLVVNPLFKLASGQAVSDYELQSSSAAEGLNLSSSGVSTKAGRDYFESPYLPTGTPVAGAIQRRSSVADVHIQGIAGSLNYHWVRSLVASSDSESGYFREMSTGLFRVVLPEAIAEQYLQVFDGIRRIDLKEYAPESVGGGGGLLPDERSQLMAIPTTPSDNAGIADAKAAAEAVNAKLTATRATNLDTSIPTPATIWAADTRSLTDKAGFELSTSTITAIATAVWAAADRTVTNFGSLISDIWSAATRSINVAVETDNASRIASRSDLTPVLQSISQIPTNPLLSGDYTAPNNAAAAAAAAAAIAVNEKLTDPRIEKLDRDLAHIGAADSYKADVSALPVLRSLVIPDGSRFSTVALSNAPSSSGGLTTEQNELLIQIGSDAELARMGFTNKATVNTVSAIATIWRDDGLTPAFRMRMLNAVNQPNVEEVVSREVSPL